MPEQVGNLFWRQRTDAAVQLFLFVVLYSV